MRRGQLIGYSALLGLALTLASGCGGREQPTPPSPAPPVPPTPEVTTPKTMGLAGDSIVPWNTVQGDVEVAYETFGTTN